MLDQTVPPHLSSDLTTVSSGGISFAVFLKSLMQNTLMSNWGRLVPDHVHRGRHHHPDHGRGHDHHLARDRRDGLVVGSVAAL